MRVKQKTKDLAYIRRMIRNAIDWHKVDDGMPDFWSTRNYKRTKRMKGRTLRKCEQHYVYYTRSSKAIEAIAEKIYSRVLK